MSHLIATVLLVQAGSFWGSLAKWQKTEPLTGFLCLFFVRMSLPLLSESIITRYIVETLASGNPVIQKSLSKPVKSQHASLDTSKIMFKRRG